MNGDFGKLIATLVNGPVEIILVGGLAGIARGAARVTYDVDVVYARSRENIASLARALQPFDPRKSDVEFRRKPLPPKDCGRLGLPISDFGLNNFSLA